MNEHINWAALVNPETKYSVSYTIDQAGNKHFGFTQIFGKDLTENQIKELRKQRLV